MELRQYASIVWKRLWIPVLLVVVVAGVSFLTRESPPPVYTASMRFTVAVMGQDEVPGNEDTYFAWLASEHLADDLSAIVSSQQFAEDVNRRLVAMESAVRIFPGSVSGITFGEKQHRVLQINLTWSNPDELAEIGQAMAATLQEESGTYAAQLLGTPNTIIRVIDQLLVPVAIPPSLTQRLDLPIRLILALIAGIALTFLLDYLDTSIRNGLELEQMDIAVLAEVPKH